MQTLKDENSQELIKVANLVLQNFDDLLPLSTAQGQRIKKFVELAHTNWDKTSSDFQPVSTQTVNTINSVSQIKSLRVGPFRGFSKQETFDLGSSLVLIYGPNGTGKSSFCEALEYGLLGSVTEAESKRFREQNDYLKNAHTECFTAPVICAMDSQGREVALLANQEAYRFCFVEKNRIDSFSRIAAQPPSKQTELISTLFGMDTFSEFVRNFTAEIDGKYIDLNGVKANELRQKRQTLAGYELQRKINFEELGKLEAEEIALASAYSNNVSFAQMVIELRGNTNKAGQISIIESELRQPLATKSDLSITKLKALQQRISNDLACISARQIALSQVSQQVSFKQLYEAVSQTQPSSPEHCPACNTTLEQVAVNPYIRASEELKKLQYLAQLQQDVQQLNETISQSLYSLSLCLSICTTRLAINNPLSKYTVSSISSANIDWWNSLHHILNNGITPWQQLENQIRELERTDTEIEKAMQLRETKQQTLAKFREYDTKITQLQTRRITATDTINSANKIDVNFDLENWQLIADVEAEYALVNRNKAIASGYSTFVSKLNEYKNKLPAELVADLGDKVAELYNAFNRNDLPSERLTSVRLPLSQHERLTISFQVNPTVFFDALHILSEGHIRCIGLAILLAKNIKENCPLIIFDDPVNAIDDDHRESIRRTLFEDKFFEEKQIILLAMAKSFLKTYRTSYLPSALRVQKHSLSCHD